jgi:hypothetical protein
MKKVIAVVLVMALIFGVTFITQFTGRDDQPTDKKSSLSLAFGHSEVKRDPTSDDPQNRYFVGFYEKGAENSVLFWFRNEGTEEAVLTFLGVSCTTCTGIRMAVVPQAALDEFVVHDALAVLPIGPAGIPTLLPIPASMDLLSKLEWVDCQVDKPGTTIKIPPATGPNRPTWGVVRFGFKAHVLGPWDPKAGFSVQSAGNSSTQPVELGVHFVGVEPFNVSPIEVGISELAEGAVPASFDLHYWSVMRPQSELPPPQTRVGGDDPFVDVGKPVIMTAEELAKVAAKIGASLKDPNLSLRSGYRIPVTVRREAPGHQPDIGLFEKFLFVTGPGDRVLKVLVKGRVTGLVWIEDGQRVDMKSYNYRSGTSTTATLVTGKPDLELTLVPEETRPVFLKASLGAAKDEPGRRTWPLTLTVAPNEGAEPNWTGLVVLKTGGPNPQKVRVTVIGNGR